MTDVDLEGTDHAVTPPTGGIEAGFRKQELLRSHEEAEPDISEYCVC